MDKKLWSYFLNSGGGVSFPTDNLVSYWPMNGSGEDIGGGGNTLAIFGGVTFPAGKDGLCADLNGTTGYLAALDSDNLSFGNGSVDTPFSVSFWMNMTVAPATSDFFIYKRDGSNREWQINISSDSFIGASLWSQNGSSSYIQVSFTTALTLNTWYYITFTYDGGGVAAGVKLYINSVNDPIRLGGDFGSYVAMNNTTAPFEIGRFNGGFYDGLIDELAIFSKELSQSEIDIIYNNGDGKFYSNL